MELSSSVLLVIIVLIAAIYGSTCFFMGKKWERAQSRIIEEEESSSEYSDDSETSDSDEEENPDYSLKMVLCVRKDLPMTKGKTCAQCCHAAVGAVDHSRKHRKETLQAWRKSGCKKVALSCPDESTFFGLVEAADNAGLINYAVCDAGRTQLEPNTFTVVAIGPDREERIDAITGREGCYPLKLL